MNFPANDLRLTLTPAGHPQSGSAPAPVRGFPRPRGKPGRTEKFKGSCQHRPRSAGRERAPQQGGHGKVI